MTADTPGTDLDAYPDAYDAACAGFGVACQHCGAPLPDPEDAPRTCPALAPDPAATPADVPTDGGDDPTDTPADTAGGPTDDDPTDPCTR